MRSAVAERMRAELAARLAGLSPEERVALALRLGDEAVAAYAEREGLDLAQARSRLRQAGENLRRKSRHGEDRPKP